MLVMMSSGSKEISSSPAETEEDISDEGVYSRYSKRNLLVYQPKIQPAISRLHELPKENDQN